MVDTPTTQMRMITEDNKGNKSAYYYTTNASLILIFL